MPQGKTSSLDPPKSSDEAIQHSSSPNLIHKVQDWRDRTYSDGSLKEHEEGQYIGSGVYHPNLNVSNCVNPRGTDITNTTSRAELAAIAPDHTWLLPYSHRQPRWSNLKTLQQKAGFTPRLNICRHLCLLEPNKIALETLHFEASSSLEIWRAKGM